MEENMGGLTKTKIILFILAIEQVANAYGAESIVGAYGGTCLNQCERHGYNYYYCETNTNSWDYCSPVWYAGAYGQVCKSDHPCGKYGYGYTWCYTESGSWDYCSFYKYSNYDKLTRYGYHCNGNCLLYGSYYYCYYKGSNWEYCSVSPYKTYKDEQCKDDHYCGKHGYTYYWCYTSTSWDYCSPVENCAYWPALAYSTKHVTQTLNQISNALQTECTVQSDTHTEIVFYYDPNSRSLTAPRTRAERTNAQVTTAPWTAEVFTGDERAGTLYRHRNMRMDLQGFFTRDGIRYANIQLQVDSVTLAAVYVPVNERYPPRYFRRALSNSLDVSRAYWLMSRRRFILSALSAENNFNVDSIENDELKVVGT